MRCAIPEKQGSRGVLLLTRNFRLVGSWLGSGAEWQAPKSHTYMFIPSCRTCASTYSPGGSGALSVNLYMSGATFPTLDRNFLDVPPTASDQISYLSTQAAGLLRPSPRCAPRPIPVPPRPASLFSARWSRVQSSSSFSQIELQGNWLVSRTGPLLLPGVQCSACWVSLVWEKVT